MICRKAKRNFVSQWYHVKQWQNVLYGNFEKSFLQCEKKGFKKHLPAHFPREFFFRFVLLISNRTVFHVQLKLICTSEFFKKLKLHLPKRLVQFQLFEKLTRANKFQIELETVWLPILTVYASVKFKIFVTKLKIKLVFFTPAGMVCTISPNLSGKRMWRNKSQYSWPTRWASWCTWVKVILAKFHLSQYFWPM